MASGIGCARVLVNAAVAKMAATNTVLKGKRRTRNEKERNAVGVPEIESVTVHPIASTAGNASEIRGGGRGWRSKSFLLPVLRGFSAAAQSRN
jgi:hypothetical protein